jgi:signal transduction histidine kinase
VRAGFQAPGGSPPKCEILIVDDLKENLLALDAILARDGVTIHQALSGQEALELMMKHEFCLAIVDVKMPGMSGFDLAELMRGTKKTRSIPIIFVTATAKEQNFSFKGYESGAVDFLLKPLDNHAVKSKVSIFIELDYQKKELSSQLATITGLLEDLGRSKVEAERANASKTEFLAHMSHEIRTPIGAILGFSDLLKNPDNTAEENRGFMKVVERNSHLLLRLIDDILDLSKVEAGKTTIENIEFSLADVIADLISVMSLKAGEKRIDFRFKTKTKIPSVICADPYRLRQILNNVIGNAIKFTERGHVEMAVGFENETLRFTIQDTGVGITLAQEDRLFHPFSQADQSTTRKFGGTGLGLVLSRGLAEAMGGTVKLLEGDRGKGSTFQIDIHSRLVAGAKMIAADEVTLLEEQPTDKNRSAQVLSGLKVLLIEDSPDNRMLIMLYLGKAGATVTPATNGAQGVELAMSEKFDVILMDIQMPILDGHQSTRKLRSLGYEKPIVALTAHAMKEEREKSKQSGFTEFLTKPIQRQVLIEILTRYVP